MSKAFYDIAFTPSVQAEQSRHGSRAAYANSDIDGGTAVAMSANEIEFIGDRDSFFLASVSESGWPYVQHRGGPVGFVRTWNNTMLGWAEYIGNRQYVSAGNTAADERVAMIFMDFEHRRRLKVLGLLHGFEMSDRPDLALRLAVDGYRARVDRLVTVTVAAFDWNCPQHITPRFTLPEIETMTASLRARIAELQTR